MIRASQTEGLTTILKICCAVLCLLVVILPCRRNTLRTAGAEEAVRAEVRIAEAGGVRMNYAAFGSGEKNLLILPGLSLHGVTGSASAVAQAFGEYTEQYTLYLSDGPETVAEGYTVSELARDTAAVMDALGIEKADIFGASLGGMTALYLAADYPDKVGRMVIASAPARANDTFRSVLDDWIGSAKAKNETALLESFADHVYSEGTLALYRDLLISQNRGVTEKEYERFVILAEACRAFDCCNDLGRISSPVLVIGSEGDRIVTAEGIRELAEGLDCALVLYDESFGHAVYDEAPDFRRRCLDFLSGSD